MKVLSNKNTNVFMGLFFVSSSLMAFEITMTRIFSAVTWYYFAFFAISVAMFGITMGSLFVYIFEDKIAIDKGDYYANLFKSSLFQSVSMVFAVLFFLSSPFLPRMTGVGIFHSILVFLVLSIPFFFGGIVTSICLTKLDVMAGSMYAFDLIGAAVGAFSVVCILDYMDAISLIFLFSVIGMIGSYFFMRNLLSYSNSSGDRKWYVTTLIVLILLLISNSMTKMFQIEWVHSHIDRPLVELWSSTGRVTVYPPVKKRVPFSWGLSSKYKAKRIIVESMIILDGVCETVMTLFDPKKPTMAEHLLYDVTFIGNHLQKGGNIFIIGAGGGRDIVAAYLSGQKEIVAAEVNNKIIRLLEEKPFSDFTGDLSRLPGVRLIHGEARSVLSTLNRKFDLIQASCIATWSATSAGAFSLAENSLYTEEAWKVFWEHLSERGILSFNRWFSVDYPAQLLRLTSLAALVLKEEGVVNPNDHIVVVRNKVTPGRPIPSGTILVSKRPFRGHLLSRLNKIAEEYDFVVEYSPIKRNNRFGEVIDNVGNERFYERQPLDISPPNDNRPYFFHMLRVRDAFKIDKLKFVEQRFNLVAVNMLLTLLLVTALLSFIFITVPPLLYAKMRGEMINVFGSTSLFFIAIGVAFMLIELSFVQRLVVFLGHPTYSITVVLSSLLLSGGIGALVSDKLRCNERFWVCLLPFLLLIAVIGLIILRVPLVLETFSSKSLFLRVLVSLVILVPTGFLMGFPFPLGMNLVKQAYEEQGPWLWGVNGAASVVSSVLATVISIGWGINVTLELGLSFYFLALLAFCFMRRSLG